MYEGDGWKRKRGCERGRVWECMSEGATVSRGGSDQWWRVQDSTLKKVWERECSKEKVRSECEDGVRVRACRCEGGTYCTMCQKGGQDPYSHIKRDVLSGCDQVKRVCQLKRWYLRLSVIEGSEIHPPVPQSRRSAHCRWWVVEALTCWRVDVSKCW